MVAAQRPLECGGGAARVGFVQALVRERIVADRMSSHQRVELSSRSFALAEARVCHRELQLQLQKQRHEAEVFAVEQRQGLLA
jgi:hypothetical protein